MNYIGLDQHGNVYPIQRHPRAELMEQVGRKNARKMYCDRNNGKSYFIGYCVGQYWIRVYGVEGRTFEREA